MNQSKNKIVQSISPNRYFSGQKIGTNVVHKNKAETSRNNLSPLNITIKNQSDEQQQSKQKEQSKQIKNLKSFVGLQNLQIISSTPEYQNRNNLTTSNKKQTLTQRKLENTVIVTQQQKYFLLGNKQQKKSKVISQQSSAYQTQKQSQTNTSQVQNQNYKNDFFTNECMQVYQKQKDQQSQQKCTSFQQILKEKDNYELQIRNTIAQTRSNRSLITNNQENVASMKTKNDNNYQPDSSRSNLSITQIDHQTQKNKENKYKFSIHSDDENLNAIYIEGKSNQQQGDQKHNSIIAPIRRNLNNELNNQQQEDDRDLFNQIIKQRSSKSQREIQQKQIHKKSQASIQIFCHNHENKQAKFYLIDRIGKKKQLCADCSILNAYNQKIIYSGDENKKLCVRNNQQQWEKLKWEIQIPQNCNQIDRQKLEVVEQYMVKNNQLFENVQMLNQILKSCESQQGIITNLQFNEYLMDSIMAQIRQKLYDETKFDYKQCISLEFVDKEIQNIIRELNQIKNDIEINIVDIVTKMSQNFLIQILENYNNKSIEFSNQIQQIYKKLNRDYGILDIPDIQRKIEQSNILLLSDIQKQSRQLEDEDSIIKSIKKMNKDNIKQVCISFENKEHFQQIQIDKTEESLIEFKYQPEQLRTEDSIVLRSNEKQQFLQFLKKDSLEFEDILRTYTNERQFQNQQQSVIQNSFQNQQMMQSKQDQGIEIGQIIKQKNLLLSPNFNDQYD